mgnify:CR=1 FL=1
MALEKANQYLSIGHYSPLTIRNYLTELRFIFVYYSDVDPMDFTEDMLMGYLLYLSKTLGCSRVKCKMAAQSISFFMRIKIVQGKGAKDRYTIMSQRVLLELRAYYLIYKPKEYLFNGYRPGKRYSVRSTYGYLANRNRHQRINEVLRKMKLPPHKGLLKIPLQLRLADQFGIDMEQCPCCKNKTLKLVTVSYSCLSGRQAWKQANPPGQPP